MNHFIHSIITIRTLACSHESYIILFDGNFDKNKRSEANMSGCGDMNVTGGHVRLSLL